MSNHRVASPSRGIAGGGAFLIGLIILAAAGGFSCERDVVSGPVGALNVDASAVGAAPLLLTDLPAALELSPDQRTAMQAALTNLADARQARRSESEKWREMREQRRGERKQERRESMRRHAEGSDRKEERRAARAAGDSLRPTGRGGAGGEPPILRFLEESSQFLDSGQFRILAEFLADRRASLGPMRERGPRDRPGRGAGADSLRHPRWNRMPAMHGDRFESHLDRQAEFLSRVLHLGDEQQAQVRSILEQTFQARRSAIERARSGEIARSDVAADMARIHEAAAAQVRALLSEEQVERFDALALLIPKGFRGAGAGRASAIF